MAELATDDEEMNFTDMPVGEILRRTREHYDQSIEDVERALRIRASQIEAIEQGDLKALPGKVYATGFVRSYSEYLGLDGDKMVALFKRQAAGETDETELHYPVMPAESRTPPIWLILTCVFLMIAVIATWFGENPEERAAVKVVPPVPQELKAAVEAPKPPPQPPEEETPVIEEKPPEGIILNIRQNSWVEIRDQQGKAMLSRVLKAGDQYYVPDRPDLTISIGNAAGVEIEVDGEALRPLGKKGKVVRRLPLDAEYLKENFALESAGQ